MGAGLLPLIDASSSWLTRRTLSSHDLQFTFRLFISFQSTELRYFPASKGEIHLKILQTIPWSFAEIENKVGAGQYPMEFQDSRQH